MNKNGHSKEKIFKKITFIYSNRFINTDGSKPYYLNDFIFGTFGNFKFINYLSEFDIQIQLSRNKNNTTNRDE